jgi:predicted DNA-binding transcriptional regulator YafY
MGAPLTRRPANARNVALVRLFRLMRLLLEPRTIPELAAALGVTTRTVRRDLKVLQAAQLPIWRSFETGRWQMDHDLEGVA